MDLGLAERVAIVTGASRGIGRAIAAELAAAGMQLVLVARTRAALEELAAAVGRDCLVEARDLREPEVPAALVAAALARFGQIDLVVNCAGATRRGEFAALSDADWADGFALKFHGAMRLCRAAWPALKARRGAIVNIAGVGGRTASADFTIGGAVNAALLNLTKALADLGTRDGVRVNAVNPGWIATARLDARVAALAGERGMDAASARSELAATLRVERFGEPAEIARLVAFLASPLASYCQGAIVDADGGLTRTL